MAGRIIYESNQVYMKKKILLWAIPIMIIFVSIFYLSTNFNISGIIGLIIGIIWLGLLIYFKTIKPKKK